MTIAAITVNAVLGSTDNALIGTTYTLSTNGGFAATVTQVTWTLIDRPPDSVATFLDSASGVPDVVPPFTNRLEPDNPGTYLFQLEIVDTADGTTTDLQGISVRHLPTKRVPGVGEADQFDSPGGWAVARNEDLIRADIIERQIMPFNGYPMIVYNKTGSTIPRNSLAVVYDTAIAANLNVTRMTDILGHSHVAGRIPKYVVQARVWTLGAAPVGDEYAGFLLFALDAIPTNVGGFAYATGFNFHDTSAFAAVGDSVFLQDDGSLGPAVGTIPKTVGQVIIKGTSSSDNAGYVFLDSRLL